MNHEAYIAGYKEAGSLPAFLAGTGVSGWVTGLGASETFNRNNPAVGIPLMAGGLGLAAINTMIYINRLKKRGKGQRKDLLAKKKRSPQDEANLAVLEDFRKGGEI